MKKTLFPVLAILILAISCKKSSSDAAPAAIPYMAMSSGSTWNYELINNLTVATTLYTLTSTNRDSTINGKAYHVYLNSSGSVNEYYNITGNDYYTFRNLGAAFNNTSIESVYLKDNSPVGTSWVGGTVNFSIPGIPLPVTVTFTNTIAEKGISKVVNGITYNDVIHVTTTVSVPGIPAASITTDIQAYFARKYGAIQYKNKISFPGGGINIDQQTNLKTSVIL